MREGTRCACGTRSYTEEFAWDMGQIFGCTRERGRPSVYQNRRVSVDVLTFRRGRFPFLFVRVIVNRVQEGLLVFIDSHDRRRRARGCRQIRRGEKKKAKRTDLPNRAEDFCADL